MYHGNKCKQLFLVAQSTRRIFFLRCHPPIFSEVFAVLSFKIMTEYAAETVELLWKDKQKNNSKCVNKVKDGAEEEEAT
jgi:hypothetical protein